MDLALCVPSSFPYVYLVCISVCIIYLVISPVFLCIHVTILAVGLLFWPQPALESHLHPSQSLGPPWGLSSVLSPSPTCRHTLVFPQAPHQACGQGHLVMDSSVGGRRPEETHMLTYRTQCRYKDTHTHTKTSRDSIPPAAVKEREEEIGKRRGLLIGITKALLMKGSCVCVCVCVSLVLILL